MTVSNILLSTRAKFASFSRHSGQLQRGVELVRCRYGRSCSRHSCPPMTKANRKAQWYNRDRRDSEL